MGAKLPGGRGQDTPLILAHPGGQGAAPYAPARQVSFDELGSPH